MPPTIAGFDMRTKTVDELVPQVDEFNRAHPVGTPVEYWFLPAWSPRFAARPSSGVTAAPACVVSNKADWSLSSVSAVGRYPTAVVAIVPATKVEIDGPGRFETVVIPLRHVRPMKDAPA